MTTHESPDAKGMFARYFLELPLSTTVVEDALLAQPGGWVPGLVEDVEQRGEALLGEVGLTASGRLQKRVVIEFRDPIRFPSRTVLPMTWRAASNQSLFPVFEADVEVAELGPHRTQLAISARYRPPLGPVGAAIDRALLHRVAETMVKDFLDRAGDKLVSLAAAPPAPPAAGERSPSMGP
ncbi:MAG: hypothetical protein WD004_03190 [Actinomycetota bacterium]